MKKFIASFVVILVALVFFTSSTHAQTASLRIISPNGGETLVTGSTTTITWTGQGLPSDGKLRFILVDESGRTVENLINKVGNQCFFNDTEVGRTGPCIDANAGSISFHLPVGMQLGQFRLLLSCFKLSGLLCSVERDTSDGLFTITDSSVPSTPSPTRPCSLLSSDLTIGSTGSQVVILQTMLISLGFDIPAISSGSTAKGTFGAGTAAAVSSYQSRNFLSVTGFVDSATRHSLNQKNCSNATDVAKYIEAVLLSADVSKNSIPNDGDVGNFNIKFNLRATSTDLKIPKYATTSTAVQSGTAFMYSMSRPGVEVPGGFVIAQPTTLNADDTTAYYVIRKGFTRQFEINASFVAPVTGQYQMKLRSVPVQGQIGNAVFSGDLPVAGFQTNYIALTARPGLPIPTTPTTTPTTPPFPGSVSVISPNGGETFVHGKPITVTWRGGNFGDSDARPLYVSLSIVSQDAPGYPSFIGQARQSSYVFTWDGKTACNGIRVGGACQEPKILPPGKYRIFVSSADLFDASDTYFTLASSTVSTPNPEKYPGFYMNLDRKAYSLTDPAYDQAYLTLSRADGSTVPFGIDIYASAPGATSNVLLSSNVSVSQNTLYKINLRDSVFQRGGNGQYTILICAAGQDCKMGSSSNTNRNSTVLTVGQSTTPVDTSATRKDQVRQLYLDLQHREPDQEGWDYWVNTGYDVSTMKQYMMQGIEYTTKTKIQGIFLKCGKGTPTNNEYEKWYRYAEKNGYNTETVRVALGCADAPVETVEVPVITEFRISHNITNEVRSTNLVWNTRNATYCTLASSEYNIGKDKYSGKDSVSTGNLTSDAKYTLSCFNTTPWSSSKTLTISVPPVTPKPSVRLSVSPSSVVVGQTAIVSWSSENATSCNTNWTRGTATSGSVEVSSAITADSTYKVSCVNKDGVWANESVTLKVVPGSITAPEPAPRAEFFIEGKKSHTYNVRETNNYEWKSDGNPNNKYSSSYVSTGGPICGGGPWVANSANGNSRTYIGDAYAGCTWTVTYTVTNTKTGQSASDTVVVKVNPNNTSLTPTVWNALKALSW